MIIDKNFSIDLATKTQDFLPINGEDKVSHLLNLYLGMVVIPTHILSKHNLWDNMNGDLTFYNLTTSEAPNNHTLRFVAELITEALISGNVEYKDENRGHISKVCFHTENNNIELTNEQLRKFAQTFATEYLSVAENTIEQTQDILTQH